MAKQTSMAESQQKKTTATKTTEAAKKVRPLVKGMYTAAQEAKAQGKLIAYAMISSLYDEIMHAMDIYPVWTENYAALCAAKRQAERFILKAEGDGYSNMVCSYVRTGLGFDALRGQAGEAPEGAPDGGMPKADLLLGSSCGCDPRFKWYQAMGRYANIPTYAHDVVLPPFTADPHAVQEQYVRYQTAQLKGLVDFLETTTGKKLDEDRLWEKIRLADEATLLWWQAYQLRKAIPGPMPSEDHFAVCVPGLFMKGTVAARDFYRELLAELQYRVANGIGILERERHRLLWSGGIPPWHTMWVFNYFGGLGAAFVMDSVYRTWDPVEVPRSVRDPLEYIATRYYLSRTIRYERARQVSGNADVEYLLDLIDGYAIDGLVMHVSRSCRASSMGQIYNGNLINKYVPIPVLQLSSDLVDVRDYSETQWRTQIDAFVEVLEAGKGKQN